MEGDVLTSASYELEQTYSENMDLCSLRKMHLQALSQSLLETIISLTKRSCMNHDQDLKEHFLEGAARRKISKHFDILPPKYLFSIQNVDDVLLHMNLLERANADPDQLAIHISDHVKTKSQSKRVLVCSVDKYNLLSSISNALSQLGNRIIEADAMTTTTGFALDSFIISQNPDKLLSSSQLEEFIKGYLNQHDRNFSPQPKSLCIPTLSEENGMAWTMTCNAIRRYDSVFSSVSVDDSLVSSSPSTDSLDQSLKLQEHDYEDHQLKIPFHELEIHEKVGNGRRSFTHRAFWSGKMVALKIFDVGETNHRDCQKTQDVITEFEREIAIVHNLRHPNVCQFYGIAVNNPSTYAIVFEFIHGGTLTSLLQNSQRSYDFFQIARDIAEGMKYLHFKGIIHRDLKSGNVLIDLLGNAKIADFGLSRFVASGEELTAETGTYRWMAPEVIQHKPYSIAADVFSYAVVMWELLTRQVPYADLSPIQAAFAVVKQGYRLPLPPRTPSRLASLIRRCWQSDQTARPLFPDIILCLDDLKQRLRQSESSNQSSSCDDQS